jgi:hypothetical protein
LRIGLLLQETPKLRPLVPAAGQPIDFVPDKVAQLPTTLDRTDPLLKHYYQALIGPDGRRLALWNYSIDSLTKEEDKKQGRSPFRLQVFDSWTWKPLSPVIDTKVPLNRDWVAFSPDGRRVATFLLLGPRGQNSEVRVWNIATGKLVGTAIRPDWSFGEDRRFRLAFSTDGRWITLEEPGFYQSRMGAWEVETGKPLQLPERYHYVAFSSDGKRALTMWNQLVEHRINLAAHIWDLETGKRAGPRLEVEDVRQACFSPDGRRVLIVERYGFGVWDVPTGRRVHARLPIHVQAAVLSPDGRRFATAVQGTQSQIQVWDAATGAPASPPISGVAERLQFTPDGRCLLSSSKDSARLWDASTGEPLTGPLKGMGNWEHWQPFTARITPDGKELYSRLRKETRQFQVRRLSPEPGTVADLARLSQALCGKKLVGQELIALPAAELLELRRETQTRFPSLFGTPVRKLEEVLSELPDPRVSMLLEMLMEPLPGRQTRATSDLPGEYREDCVIVAGTCPSGLP